MERFAGGEGGSFGCSAAYSTRPFGQNGFQCLSEKQSNTSLYSRRSNEIMLSDIEIASAAKMLPIDQIAQDLGVLPEELEPYGLSLIHI